MCICLEPLNIIEKFFETMNCELLQKTGGAKNMNLKKKLRTIISNFF